MFKHFEKWQMEDTDQETLEAISGVSISLLTNTPEQCYDREHHEQSCIHEKGDEPCSVCVSCNPKHLYKSDVFWWTSDSFTHRYKHEEAKVGDVFYDGNNGDKHKVVAVDLESSRLAFRNCDQCEKLLEIACW